MSSHLKSLFYPENRDQFSLRPGFDVDKLIDEYTLLISKIQKEHKNKLSNTLASIEFDITLPTTRTKQEDRIVGHIHSQRECNAAQNAIHHMDKLAKLMMDEIDQVQNYPLKSTPTLEGFRQEKGKLKRRIISPLFRIDDNLMNVFSYFTYLLFDSKQSSFYGNVKVTLHLGNEFEFSEDMKRNTGKEIHDISSIHSLYSQQQVNEILFDCCRNTNVSFKFAKKGEVKSEIKFNKKLNLIFESGLEYVEREKIENLEFTKSQDIPDSVLKYGIVDISHASNKKDEKIVSRISSKIAPGGLLFNVLGNKKAWKVNTYLTEKLCNVLDEYNIDYFVRFSGNKSWYVEIDTRLRNPCFEFKKLVKLIAEQIPGFDLTELEQYKEFADPFFFARRFVDVLGASVMINHMSGLINQGILDFDDLKKLGIKFEKFTEQQFYENHKEVEMYNRTFGTDDVAWLFKKGNNYFKVDLQDLVSINPYSALKRSNKVLIDHSSNRYEGHLRGVLSVHIKSGLVSIPALHNRDKKGKFRFSEQMWDYDSVCELALIENVIADLEKEGYDWPSMAKERVVNKGTGKFDEFVKNNRGLFYYVLRYGAEKIEQLDYFKAKWVEKFLWEKVNKIGLNQQQRNFYPLENMMSQKPTFVAYPLELIVKNRNFVNTYFDNYNKLYYERIAHYRKEISREIQSIHPSEKNQQRIQSLLLDLDMINQFKPLDENNPEMGITDIQDNLMVIYNKFRDSIEYNWATKQIQDELVPIMQRANEQYLKSLVRT